MIRKPMLRALLLAGASLSSMAGETQAQVQAQPFPGYRTSDALNVDVTTGLPFWNVQDVNIGPPDAGLAHSRSSYKASMLSPQDSFWGGLTEAGTACNFLGLGTAVRVVWQQTGECFYLKDGVYTSYEKRGNSLEAVPGGHVYTLADGTVISISSTIRISAYQAITRIARPDGLVTDLHFQAGSSQRWRLRTVANSNGFRLQYEYASNDPASPAWSPIQSVVGYNAAEKACDPQQGCALEAHWPRSSYSEVDNGTTIVSTITDSGGQSIAFTFDRAVYPYSGRINRVRLPTSTVDNVVYNYCPNQPGCSIQVAQPGGAPQIITINDLVVSATLNGQLWTYGLINAGPYALERNSTGPTGEKVVVNQTLYGSPNSLKEPSGTFTFDGTPAGHVMSVARAEGYSTGVQRDVRGNIVASTDAPAAGSGLSPAVTTYVFPATCSNRVTCNRPTLICDPKGGETTFEYDPVHGGVTRATGPLVDGVSREIRYQYTQRPARFRDASGAVVQALGGLWVLERESTCRTGPAVGQGCALPDDEVVTLYEYGPSSGVNNLLLRGVVKDATRIALRTCYGYDRYGNRIRETSPKANLTVCS